MSYISSATPAFEGYPCASKHMKVLMRRRKPRSLSNIFTSPRPYPESKSESLSAERMNTNREEFEVAWALDK